MPRGGPFWSILEYKQTDIYDSYTLVSNIQYLVWAWWSGVTKVCWANGVTRVCPGLIPALLPADHLLWAATNIAFNLNNLILINLTLTNLIIINPTSSSSTSVGQRGGCIYYGLALKDGRQWPTRVAASWNTTALHTFSIFNLSFRIFRALYIFFFQIFYWGCWGGGRFLRLSIFFPLAIILVLIK